MRVNKLNELSQAINEVGYYPEVVFSSISSAIAGEEVRGFAMQHEATFDQESLHRHMTVVALTATRLILCHTDENAPDDNRPYPSATSATEAVKLSAISSVVVHRTFRDPAVFKGADSVEEIVITLGWGGVTRHEIGPAACDDPECEAEHGFSGTTVNEDLSIRVSRAADGANRINAAIQFADVLAKVTATREAW
ncbi:MAG: hypothetical protein RL410_419 [Actinomycetota bacterium]